MEKQIKAAIAGCGVISDIYLQNLTSRFEIIKVVGCYDRNQWKMDLKQEKYGVKPMSYEEILNNPEIEMVINCIWRSSSAADAALSCRGAAE